jgi:hypothetical protein
MLPQLDGLKMHVPLTTKMQLRSQWLSCYKLPIETYSNCMSPELDGLKMHVPLTMKMQLRTQWLSCYKLPIETYSNCMLSQLDGLKTHVSLTMQMQLRTQWLKCYQLPIETYSNCMLSHRNLVKLHVAPAGWDILARMACMTRIFGGLAVFYGLRHDCFAQPCQSSGVTGLLDRPLLAPSLRIVYSMSTTLLCTLMSMATISVI